MRIMCQFCTVKHLNSWLSFLNLADNLIPQDLVVWLRCLFQVINYLRPTIVSHLTNSNLRPKSSSLSIVAASLRYGFDKVLTCLVPIIRLGYLHQILLLLILPSSPKTPGRLLGSFSWFQKNCLAFGGKFGITGKNWDSTNSPTVKFNFLCLTVILINIASGSFDTCSK